MTNCPVCEATKNPLFKVEDVAVYIPEKPVNNMHLAVASTKHFTILEDIPDADAGKLFTVANLMSAALFAKIRAAGTNLLIQNGVPAGQTSPHLIVNIIGRAENDGLEFSWEPKEVSEEELSSIEFQIKEGGGAPAVSPLEAAPPKTQKFKKKRKGKNYMIDNLTRRP